MKKRGTTQIGSIVHALLNPNVDKRLSLADAAVLIAQIQ